MAEKLLSVGLDVGTTSTQLVVSQLSIENKAGSFAVPEMEILQRQVVYTSPVYFTPLKGENLVDGDGIRRIVEEEYRSAGIRREDVDTGAVIVTGETSRKENARAVLDSLSDFAGDFVVATAGPDLESVLAAKGAGADAFSAETGKSVLHMDIGGGTSNLAWIEEGKITQTGCLNVGGRLIKFDKNGGIYYVSPVLDGICSLKVGDMATKEALQTVAESLVQALEMAAGLREETELLEKLWTRETNLSVIVSPEGAWQSPENIGILVGFPRQCAHWLGMTMISFSGGVADCIERETHWQKFGDMGPVLGQAIRNSRLCQNPYRLGEETIRATVIGAGCHSAQLSGSTVFYQNVSFPVKNLPVICLTQQEQESADLAEIMIRRRSEQDSESLIHLPGRRAPDYGWVKDLAGKLVAGFAGQSVYVAVENDMAKALGQAMAALLPGEASCLCIDSVKLTQGSYLDVGAPVGPALPVVVKTLVLSK